MVTSHSVEGHAFGAPHAADLGPLAWVLDETRKSMESVVKLLRRFAADAQSARGVDLATVDAGPLRVVRQQLHQVVGALDMVGQAVPAQMVRSMEMVVQQFVAQPETCTEGAVQALERPAFALVEYLESQISETPRSALGLFPQYRQLEEMAGADWAHPSDLWLMPWRWADPATPAPSQVLTYGGDVRSRLDQRILKIMKYGDTNAAAECSVVCLGLAQGESGRQANAFWKLAAAFFEAIAHQALAVDIYVKRTASRVLLQYASLARGDKNVPERLAHSLLFFTAQAQHTPDASLPIVDAVKAAWGLADYVPHDYERAVFGLYDPAVLGQARRRIDVLKENWSALAGGDMARARAVTDQFALVGESLTKLHPNGHLMAEVLNRIAAQTARLGQPPSSELAMEVATAVLFWEASLADFHPADVVFSERVRELVRRLEVAHKGQPVPPLQPWMEDLYRSVSDRQTMGTVVSELRATLNEVEQGLDQFFRETGNKSTLVGVAALMGQMRGVLSVLGLDQTALAVGRMRELVEGLLASDDAVEACRLDGTFDRLGASVSALGFQVDMLGYQPLLARKLFAYDERTGDLRYLGGRQAERAADAGGASEQEAVDLLLDDASGDEAELPGFVSGEAPALVAESTPSATVHEAVEVPVVAAPAQPSEAVHVSVPEIDDELLEIFLDEVKEVVLAGVDAVRALRTAPADIEQQTTLRRAFHTLKGSSRMVGLLEFGEAAWSMEQLLNAWLADKNPASDHLLTLSEDAMQAFGAWARDIGTKSSDVWSSAPFRASADSLRLQGAYVPLRLEQAPAPQGGELVVAGAPSEGGVDPGGLALDAPPVATPADELVEEAGAADEAMAVIFPGLAVPTVVEEADATGGACNVFSDTELLATVPAALPEVKPTAEVDELKPLLSMEEWDGAASPSLLEEPSVTPDGVLSDAAESSPLEGVGEPEVVEAVTPAESEQLTEEAGVLLTSELSSLKVEDEPEVIEAVAPADPEQLMEASASPVLEASSSEILDGGSGLVETVVPAELERSVEEAGTLLVSEPSHVDANDTPEVVDVTTADEEPDGGSAGGTLGLSLDELGFAVEEVVPTDLPESATAFSSVAAGALSAEADDYQQVGDLRVSTSLFNVYLGEADDWSRQLEAELLAWSKQLDQAVPEHAISCAHALVGSSATVGFNALSEMARAVEHALQRLTGQETNTSAQVEVLVKAATEIRRVLFQFGTGVLQEPSAALLTQVHALAPEVPAHGHRLVAAPAARPEAQPRIGGLGEEVDQTDAIDPDLFPIFAEEAEELFPQLSSALRVWVGEPANREARAQALRVLHTLKGSARLAGALRLGEMAHRTESTIETIGTEGVSSADLAPLLDNLDDLETTFRTLQAGDQGVEVFTPPSAAIDFPSLQVDTPLEEQAEPVVAAVPAAPVEQSAPASDAAPVVVRGDVALPVQLSLATARTSATQVVRVRAQTLDRLVAQAGEIITSRVRLEAEMGVMRSSLKDLTNNLDRLRLQLRDVELQAETQMQSRLALSKDAQQNFDPLEFDRFTRMQELTRIMAESVNDVATVQRTLQRAIEASEDDLVAQARQSRELQRDLLRTRMVEFDSLSERLYRVVRQAAKENGKQVRLDIIGGAIEMDRSVLERMTPAFEHLLRNCVVHGIETQEVRAQRGKDAAGLITIEVQQVGNDVSVSVRDDGNGLDAARIRAQAERQGLIADGQEVSDDEVLNFVFAPGFSTASEVTALAGRGVGMDVVRTEVQALGGRIETSSQVGQGVNFRLMLPLTTAVTHVVMLRAGSLVVGVPSNLVEIVRRTTQADLQAAYETGRYPAGEGGVPFYWAGALLQSSPRSAEPPARSTPVVIFKSAAQSVALHVDEVLGNQEVVVKALGPQLARLPGLVAVTALASGAVALIYNPVALAVVYGQQALAWTASAATADAVGSARPEKAAGAATSDIPLVLVVDDSITVRRVTQRLLQREGYRVALAADGLQGLEQLQGERPAVILSDIEMPRMDGFDFVRNIRADEQLRDLPVIMITSRIAEKHREHARELGVNHYLGKPYSEEELLGLIKSCVAAAANAAAAV